MGKLQGQINARIALSSAITGYTAGANTALAATDTLLAAMGKLQGQINALAAAGGGSRGIKSFQRGTKSFTPSGVNTTADFVTISRVIMANSFVVAYVTSGASISSVTYVAINVRGYLMEDWGNPGTSNTVAISMLHQNANSVMGSFGFPYQIDWAVCELNPA
jgi:hypothetical protein